ncbi:hypothetical protein CBL_02953 [Carabus blaptoides fortunei]
MGYAEKFQTDVSFTRTFAACNHAIVLCAVVLDSRETVCPISCEGCCPVRAGVGKDKQLATLAQFAKKCLQLPESVRKAFCGKRFGKATYPGSNQRLVKSMRKPNRKLLPRYVCPAREITIQVFLRLLPLDQVHAKHHPQNEVIVADMFI